MRTEQDPSSIPSPPHLRLNCWVLDRSAPADFSYLRVRGLPTHPTCQASCAAASATLSLVRWPLRQSSSTPSATCALRLPIVAKRMAVEPLAKQASHWGGAWRVSSCRVTTALRALLSRLPQRPPPPARCDEWWIRDGPALYDRPTAHRPESARAAAPSSFGAGSIMIPAVVYYRARSSCSVPSSRVCTLRHEWYRGEGMARIRSSLPRPPRHVNHGDLVTFTRRQLQ